jgi:hypothetical protein
MDETGIGIKDSERTSDRVLVQGKLVRMLVAVVIVVVGREQIMKHVAVVVMIKDCHSR